MISSESRMREIRTSGIDEQGPGNGAMGAGLRTGTKVTGSPRMGLYHRTLKLARQPLTLQEFLLSAYPAPWKLMKGGMKDLWIPV